MASNPPNPANSDLAPPATWSQSSVAFTSRSTSIADDSDVEFDPTPLQSPRGGPDFDDLPPSYDEAQSDARNGVTPLDPDQIEAHRLTLNEDPNQPEIWEYRIKGEQLDDEDAFEEAPEYANVTTETGTHVPVRHVKNSEDIPVGRTGTGTSSSNPPLVSIENLLGTALTFTQHEPDADVQYAPRLSRRIAIPPQSTGENLRQGNAAAPEFLRAYAKALHAHSIRPAEFTEFLDGLHALMIAFPTTVNDLLQSNSEGIVHDYLRGANEGFFAPRGLRVSMQSASALIAALNIPVDRGQRDGAVASIIDPKASAEMKARALYPWIEPLETDIPAQSTRSLTLHALADRLVLQHSTAGASSPDNELRDRPDQNIEDPPHSVPEASLAHAHPRAHHTRGRGRGGHRRGRWTPFGAPGQGPFGPPGNGPFGKPGRGLFGGRARFGPPSFGAHGPPPFCRDRAAGQPGSQSANEWESVGQNLGKWGEEFGRRMGEWGEQFGKQAEAWGQDFGKKAEVWGEEVSARASGSGSRHRSGNMPPPADDALPPSYQGPTGQESGVVRGDSKSSEGPPGYGDMSHTAGSSTEKGKAATKVDDDDDDSSRSSDSSDSDSDSDSSSSSDSDSDDDDIPDTQSKFLACIASINQQAEDAIRKGKKTREEISLERDLAIEKAQNEKTAMDHKIEARIAKRAAQREHRQKRRELKHEHRAKKRALKVAFVDKGKAKAKAKAKKTPEWKMAKREYKEKRKALKKEKVRARKELKERRRSGVSGAAEKRIGEDFEMLDKMVWIVVDNLDG